MPQNNKPNNQSRYALVSFLAVLLYVIIYKYALNQIPQVLADLYYHTYYIAERIYLNSIREIWLQRPYLFWHLCVKGFIKFFHFPTEAASANTCGLFAAFGFLVTYWILRKLAPKDKDTSTLCAFGAFLLSLVQPLYIPWINTYQYEGQFSINPIFNPTHMASKPFGLLAFAVGVDLFRVYKGEKPLFFFRSSNLRLYLLFGFFLFMTTITKPTFMYMLLPAGVIFILLELALALFKKDGSAKKTWSTMWRLALASVPSLCYLALEYAAFYLWGGTNADASIAIYPIFTAWHIYSDNIPVSVLMAMSFPLWMLLTNLKYFLRSVEGRLSLFGYGVGTLMFSFLVETGDKLGHLNFSWPMMAGMLLFWVVAVSRLIHATASADDSLYNRLYVSVSWVLLAVYLFSGLYYINPYQYIL